MAAGDDDTSPAQAGRPSLRSAWRSGPERVQLLNHPHSAWTRRPTARRGLAIAFVLLQVGGTALLWGSIATRWWPGLLVLLLLLEVFVIGSLNTATRGVVDLRGQELDERQLQLRAHAFERAYRVGLAIVTVGFVACFVASARTGQVWLLPLGFATFGLFLMLPTVVVAWTRGD